MEPGYLVLNEVKSVRATQTKTQPGPTLSALIQLA